MEKLSRAQGNGAARMEGVVGSGRGPRGTLRVVAAAAVQHAGSVSGRETSLSPRLSQYLRYDRTGQGNASISRGLHEDARSAASRTYGDRRRGKERETTRTFRAEEIGIARESLPSIRPASRASPPASLRSDIFLLPPSKGYCAPRISRQTEYI